MRSFVLSCLFLSALVGACSFDPNIPSGSLICNPSTPDCPRGYTCEPVVLAADRRVSACCTKAGLHRADPGGSQSDHRCRPRSRGGCRSRRASQHGCPPGTSCGNGKVESGETCDPLSSCPTTCPNQACTKRKLVDGGTCQARCVDDGMETECVGGDGCCPAPATPPTTATARPAAGTWPSRPARPAIRATPVPTACPAIGCTLQKLEGSSRTCDARCVDAGKQTTCVTGDNCCPMGCTTANDAGLRVRLRQRHGRGHLRRDLRSAGQLPAGLPGRWAASCAAWSTGAPARPSA